MRVYGGIVRAAAHVQLGQGPGHRQRDGRRTQAGTVMRPRASTSVAMAWASTMAGLDSSPPQLPE